MSSIGKTAAGVIALSLATIAQAQPQPPGASFVLVGDPQLHAVTGGYIAQSSSLSDSVIKVSRRHPEENLLAEYSLQGLLADATKLPGGQDDDMVVLLGDGTNIGCTGEYDRLDARLNEVRGDDERVVLWAHGNHDTYLTGTINNWYPHVGNEVGRPEVLEQMMASSIPVDASWWKAPKRIVTLPAWNSLCWDDAGSVPLNKGQWLARYAKSIGVTLQGEGEAPGVYRLTAKPSPGSKLEAQDFAILGKWFPPLSREYATEDAANTPYLSYIVQAINVGDRHRLILIDTSVCRVARLSLADNAGSNACIGKEQLEDIDQLADATDRALLIGAHFPIGDLSPGEQEALLAVLNKDGRPWSFFSAHTHDPYEKPIARSKHMAYAGPAGEPRYDYNVGSTTDWPMEAHRVNLDGSPTGVALSKVSSADAAKLTYERSAVDGTIMYELCRHVTVAERLAKLDLSEPVGDQWRGGARLGESLDLLLCATDTPGYAQRLRAAQARIAERMAASDPAYRERMMMIMRGASLSSKQQPTLLDGAALIVK